MKDKLNKYTKKELIKLAKDANLKGYSQLRKSELIDLLQKSNINYNSQSQKKELRIYNFAKLAPLGLLILGLLGFFGYKNINSLFNSNTSISKKSPLFSKSDSIFNILILPFNPDRECKVENIDYEKILMRRYLEMAERDSINIRCLTLNTLECFQTNREVATYGTKNNADLVLWGQYDEKCEGDNKIRLRYNLIKPVSILKNKVKGDSKMQVLNNLNLLTHGYLQKDIDYIIYKTLSLKEFSKNSFEKVKIYIANINIEECDYELLAIKFISELELNDRNFSETFEIFIKCYADEMINLKNDKHFHNIDYKSKKERLLLLTQIKQRCIEIFKGRKLFLSYLKKNKKTEEIVENFSEVVEKEEHKLLNSLEDLILENQ